MEEHELTGLQHSPSAISLALKLHRSLQQSDQRIVLAESCTAGRIAATLGCLPGISNYLCGSFVVYRNESKARWLGIPPTLLDDPRIGPISAEVTRLLALAILQHTPEAALGLAITGDIGPNAPLENDGVVYCAVVNRRDQVQCVRHILASPAPRDRRDIDARIKRLEEATQFALQAAIDYIDRW